MSARGEQDGHVPDDAERVAGTEASDGLAGLDARMDARFRAIDARFATIDRRFVSVGNRVDEVEHTVRAGVERLDSRIRLLQGHMDAVDARIDLTRDKIAGEMARERRHNQLLVLFGGGLIAVSGWLTAAAVWAVSR